MSISFQKTFCDTECLRLKTVQFAFHRPRNSILSLMFNTSSHGSSQSKRFNLSFEQALNRLHNSLSLDLDPCLNVKCPAFGVCKTYSAHDARCVCFEDCPSYEDPVCTANGTTYDNKCWYELSYCKGLDNSTVYHPGSCEGKREKLALN